MEHQQQFCLKWNSFGSNLATAFVNLFKSESLADVTLFCDGVTFKAHRLILAACSKHFQDLFEGAPLSPSILVILDGTSSANMAALLEFMYKGEVHVSQEHLSSFLKAAECLQVKGLSIEHEKLAMVQEQQQQQQQQREQSQPRGSPSSHDNPHDSPTRSSSKSSKPDANGTCKLETENGPVVGTGCFPPVLSPFMPPHHYRTPFDARPSFDCSRKRGLLGSPSEHADAAAAAQRASVLRDPRESPKSPMSFPYRPSPEPLPPSASSTPNNADAALSFDRTAAESECHKAPADSRHADSSRPEDLRIKMEPSSRSEEVYCNAMPYREADKAPEMLQIGTVWDSALSKSLKSATTADGKKLKCPFCERLYGYETNLRAHIRQRHQGIRVPCPFCSRTFTRNNTVRRHIAREHKTELNMKAYHANTVQGHAQ